MISANTMYALNHDEIVNSILLNGTETTVLVQGDMGSGKSSLLTTLSAELPDHIPVYFDCTTKDLGDLFIPDFNTIGDTGVVRMASNEELGLHHDKPIILMIDEFGKANPAVKQALLRLMLERKACGKELHKDSIVFATTNKGSEGVGDLIIAHARNRITIVTMRKPDNFEWIEWGVNNNVNPSILGWAKETPELFHSFERYEDPEENPYIYHPQSNRVAFVTPRSLVTASKWVDVRDKMNQKTLTANLIGSVGERAALDMAAFVELADQLPKRDDIINSPDTATIPSGAAATCMVVYRAAATIESKWMDAWVTYMCRLNTEAQGMFANLVRGDKYSKRSVVLTNKKYQTWALDNQHLFASDKV